MCKGWWCWIPVLTMFLGVANTHGAPILMDWVIIGDPGNMPDDTGNGAVAEEYRISRLEVTSNQYVEFLNSVATSDPNQLYIPEMTSKIGSSILRGGDPGSYSYSVKLGRGELPAVYITLWNAMRFANWMHNGQPLGAQGPGTTEDGAYPMSPDGIINTTITRNLEATVFIPSDDQWYKAAYYKSGGTNAGYWDYPTGSDLTPTVDIPPGGPNSANYGFAIGDFTNVGSYPQSPSPYGTLDQGGNTWEWTEEVWSKDHVLMRGGSIGREAIRLSADWAGSHSPHLGLIGFRLASSAVAVPEPGSAVLVVLGLVMILPCLRRVSSTSNRGRETAQ